MDPEHVSPHLEAELVTASPYPDDERSKVQTIRATGAVYLYGPEIDIVDAPEFQRLNGIKQLGTSYVVFRGATHTRFEHSLGTLQQAQKIIDAVRREPEGGRDIDQRGQRLARLAALLHDLTHIPFGHTLEDEFRLLERHDKNVERIDALLEGSQIGEILRAALDEEEYELLFAALDARPRRDGEPEDKDERLVERMGEYAYVADIVANTVCADVLDYIVRDLRACGMPVAIGDRFLDYFVITPRHVPVKAHRNRMALRLDKRGMPRPDVESEILKLLTFRYELAERVFFHHAKNAASVMIGRAVERLGLHTRDENFHQLSDELLLAALANVRVGEALELAMTDDGARRREAEELGQFVSRRHLYKLAFLGVADDDVNLRARDIYASHGPPAARISLEEELAAKAGVASGRVLVHIPTPEMMAKLAQVRVMLEGDTVTTFEDWEGRHSGRVQALNSAHQRLWRVAVYLHPNDAKNPETKRLAASAARDAFGLRSRYVEYEVDEPYLAAVFDLNVAKKDWPAGEREEIVRAAGEAAAKGRHGSGHLTLETSVEALDGIVEERRAMLSDEDEGQSGQGRLAGTD
jgi:HD superfamily phosphohydrolase